MLLAEVKNVKNGFSPAYMGVTVFKKCNMQKYNWWNDPKNKDEVDRISWWEHDENMTTIELPVSIIFDGTHYTIGCNRKTKELIGEELASITASGKSKEKAVSTFFTLMKISHQYSDECRRKYQCWVPFRKGYWKHIGGKWFVIFGIHFYFRYGKGMKGGRYIPFTDLNISINNEWNNI